MAQRLVARGITTRLIAGHATPEGVALARAHGLEPEIYGRAGDLQWIADPGFAAWLAPLLCGADAVHAHMFGAWWAAAQSVAPGQPLVASEHNAYSWPGPSHERELRQALGRVDRFYAHGPGARGTVLALGLAPSRLETGISPVAGMGAAPCAARSGVVYSGRLDPDKGPDVLLEALALMATPPPTLMMGAGRMADALRRQRTRLGLGDVVEFVGWTADPAPAIARAGVLVIPSRDESFSQTAVLGMGLGTPVVGTDVDGFPATLGAGRGIVVAPEDPAALAAAIDGVLRGRLRVDTEGARSFAAQFRPDRVAAVYEETYRAMTATPLPAAPLAA